MKNLKISLFSFLFVLCTSQVIAQLKVIPSGNTKIGVENTSASDNDPTGWLRLQIFGNSESNANPCCRPGGKLAFGDFGNPPATQSGAHNFIGEWQNYDSDALQLHGRNGIHFTAGGAGTFEVAYLDNGGTLHLRSSVMNTSSYFSDIRLKKNIKSLTGSLDNLKKLTGISYDLKTDEDERYLASLSNSKPTKQKEIEELEKTKKDVQDRINKTSKNQIGFSAQDVQAILPQLVTNQDNGFLSVNYIGIIPMLVEGIKEQQKLIEDQAKTIDTLQKDIVAIKKKIGMQ
jgi:Chaperone of endosialidase